MAPPARFELALPPPEGGALSPELRGLINRACSGQLVGRKAMYQRGCRLQLSSYVWSWGPRSILDPVPGGWWSARVALAAVLMVLLTVTGCIRQAAPGAAVQRSSPPPWSAPRDAVSYIEAAGLEPQPVSTNEKSRIVKLRVIVDGTAVEVPAYIGIDRVRSLQAAVHTHDTSGQVWLEGRGSDQITLAQFFTLWGVRFDDHCLGSACGRLVIKVDGAVTPAPRAVRLSESDTIEVEATS
jgi:hypothetical protein